MRATGVQTHELHTANKMLPQLVALLLPCAGAAPPKQYDLCRGTSVADPKLRFGIGGLPDPTGSSNQTLASAVCCDSRNVAYAEPQGLYSELKLFSHLDPSGVTTFYDSACGLALFRAPVNRSLADFEADTKEHGWPSFRPAEVVHDNVRTNHPKPGLATSACGTHLGTYLPDAQGPRWCIDLSCVSGNSDWSGCCSGCPHAASGCAAAPTGVCAATAASGDDAAKSTRCDCAC